jgi:tetratricopeptide (TPR) repeat protein
MVGKMLRTAAEAEYENRGDQGIERALELLRRADEVNEATEETDGRYRRWPEAALNADLRTLALARAGRHEEALAAAEQAIAAWTVGGDEVVGEYAQAMLNAAITEATQLGRPKQAVARLSVAITRCRSVGHEQAVAVLTRHAERFQREAEG